MSYNAQQDVAYELLKEWDKDLQYVIDGEEEECTVYKGPVTGLSLHHYREFGKQLKVGDYMQVKGDPKNKYNKNATGLFIGDKQIGWIPKAMNSVAAEAARLKCHFVARIIRHREFSGDFTNLLFVEVFANSPLTDSELDQNAADRAIDEYYKDRNKSTPPRGDPLASTTFNNISDTQKKAWAADLQKKVHPSNPLFKSQEQDTMVTKVNAVIENNIALGTNAAFLEAGRIANNQLSAIAAKKLPMMARGYADTALGRLLLANVAMAAAEHFRAGDQRLERLTKAMAVTAYQEVLQQFDIEQMIEDMLTSKTIAKALRAVDVEST